MMKQPLQAVGRRSHPPFLFTNAQCPESRYRDIARTVVGVFRSQHCSAFSPADVGTHDGSFSSRAEG